MSTGTVPPVLLDISPHLRPAADFFSALQSSPVGRISGSKLIRKFKTPDPLLPADRQEEELR
jgi:hypothetical protein